MRLTAVVLDGPFENERLNAQWTVTKLDGYGNNVGDPQRFDQHGIALSFGHALATILNVEFVDKSSAVGFTQPELGKTFGTHLFALAPRQRRHD